MPGFLLCRDPGVLAYAIKRSCENKAKVVSLDEKENGLRATLNLGHAFGHMLEVDEDGKDDDDVDEDDDDDPV
ncbi:hypothetical protein RHGRI_001025 [Rhododendron griersonianum]|uniref:3-dehydroquinate synthase C-terminal domain-containing protein n=1 Tax=Rhododendron griersonianum TaxID=479676 RepID=A0AAV6LJY2_9ERIC|nr:hypothetical protein RHGRI_001025 [Rhododendron griersonianum]